VKSRLLVFVALVLAVAGTAYAVTYYFGASRRPEGEWTWMRREFHLNPAQLARIQDLQAAYKPTCVAGCARIMAARKDVDRLERDGLRDSPAYFAAIRQWQENRRSCNEACFRHLLAVAAVMSPAEGRRYLAMMTPRIQTPEHRGLMGVR
jgi:hypothetical protein